MKRGLDILLTVAMAPIWVPVAAAVAVAVFLFMGRPVFVFDERSGLGGRPFRMVKFRSMRNGPGTDAERLTPFGRFLRASSLDELPELWNVLRGEMSLVGPRPLPVRYLGRYSPTQRRRLEVRPGVTGLAQVSGRNSISWEEKFRLDVEYVERRSMMMDFMILARTLVRVVLPSGVNSAPGETMPEFGGA
jgi:lipopolysaccharide/colanic/teichoic acid biosynthesis glycosyltransferase